MIDLGTRAALVAACALAPAPQEHITLRAADATAHVAADVLGYSLAAARPGYPPGVAVDLGIDAPRHALLDFGSERLIVVAGTSGGAPRFFFATADDALATEAFVEVRAKSPIGALVRGWVIPFQWEYAEGARVPVEVRDLPDRNAFLYRSMALRIGAFGDGATSTLFGLIHARAAIGFDDPDALRLLVDANGDRAFDASEVRDPARPFHLGNAAFRLGSVDRAGMTAQLLAYHSDKALAEGFLLPDYALEDVDGHARSTADERGRWLVLNVWETTCTGCVREIPGLNALRARFARDDGVAFVAASPEPWDVVLPFLERTPFDYRVLRAAPRPDDLVAAGFPLHLIADPAGRIRYLHVGTLLDVAALGDRLDAWMSETE